MAATTMARRTPASPGPRLCRGLPVVAALAGLVVAGCADNSVREAIGMSKQVPDEFQVVRRQPLVVPPDYNLRPPGPAQRQADQARSEEVRATLFARRDEGRSGTGFDGLGTAPSGGRSAAETALLEAVPVEPDPSIRERLVEENTELTRLDESRFLMILDWQRERMTYSDPVIDAREEAERLADEGKPVRVTTRRVDSRALPTSAPTTTGPAVESGS